jgi:hypothetical protein
MKTLCDKKENLALIHYGAVAYDPAQFKPIKDEHWIKPRGGLWTSPVDSTWSWRHWCETEDYLTGSLTKCFTVSFSGNVLVIDCLKDLDKLPWIDSLNFPLFECLEYMGVQAIHLTVRGQEETRHSRPRNLYGWDCESVLVMDPDAIHPIEI